MEATLEHEQPPALRARALLTAATMAYAQGDYTTAEERWGEALRLARREGDVPAEARAWAGKGLVEMTRPDYEAAASSLEKAIALLERCGEDHMASAMHVIFGTTLLLQGEGERAERKFEEVLASARRLKDPSVTCTALYNLAQSALARGDYAEAGRLLGEGIEWSAQTRDRASLAYFLETLAVVTTFGREAERSALLLGAAEALLEEVGARVHNYYVPDPSLRERAVAEVRAGLGDAAFEAAWSRGREMGFEQAVEYALGADANRGGSISR
jgi:non-specific serine/threonine protein kinase